jgi:hypothetical protein
MHRILAGVLATGLIAVALSGCGGNKLKPCPSTAALADAAALTAFPDGATPDPSHALYTVQITNVTTDCDFDKKFESADSSLEITFQASRPPNGAPLDASVPYFVAVTSDGGKIVTRQIFKVEFHFDPGQATTTFKDNVASIVIDVVKDKRPWDYQLLVGLQLTKAQLDYNRTVGPYTP